MGGPPICATNEVKPERHPINLPNQGYGFASFRLKRDITTLCARNNKVKIPIARDSICGVITEKNKNPKHMPTPAGNKTIFRIRLSALIQNRRRPNKSMAINKGSRIANASVRLDWLAINGGAMMPRPAPKPLFDIPRINTLIAASTKNVAECWWKAWSKEWIKGLE